MFKKSLCIVLCVMMMVTLFPVAAMAEDVQQSLPINDGMESMERVSGIKATVQSGTVSLTQDRMAGNYSVKVTAKDEPGKNYVSYTLADSVNFAVYQYSQIKVWVKPGAGAKWVKFYTNGSLICSDKDFDGVYKIGQDLTSGKWNHITLDLNSTSPVVSQGNGLSVNTNEFSTWTFDDVVSVYAPTYSIDISQIKNVQTELVNGELRFKANTPGSNVLTNSFNSTPVTLVSQRYPDYIKNDTVQTDFQQGTLSNVVATSTGLELAATGFSEYFSGVLSDYTSEAFYDTPYISNGELVLPERAGNYAHVHRSNFNTSENFTITAKIKLNAWSACFPGIGLMWGTNNGFIFGNNANYTGLVENINGTKTDYSVAATHDGNYHWYKVTVNSTQVTYYKSDNGVDWTTIRSITRPSSWAGIPASLMFGKGYWGANSDFDNNHPSAPGGNIYNAYIDDIVVSSLASTGTRTSPVLDISPTKVASSSKVSWVATLPVNTNVTLQTNLSTDGGVSWQGWQSVANGGAISGISENVSLANARLQYRATSTTSDVSATPKLHSISINITGTDYAEASSLPAGKISKINVNSSYSGTLLSQKLILSGIIPTKLALSGDGSRIFYVNPNDGNKLYLLDLYTGWYSKISDIVPVDIKPNYEGTLVGFRDSANVLYYYRGSDKSVTTISGNVPVFSIKKDGTVFYYNSSNSSVYQYGSGSTIPGLLCLSGLTVNYLNAARNGDTIFYSSASQLSSITSTPAGWKSTALVTLSKNIDGVWSSVDGKTVFIKTADGFFSYDVPSKALRKMDTTTSTVVKAIDDNKLIVQDTNLNYQLYNPDTDTSTNIRPSDAKNPPDANTVYFDVDNSGYKMALAANGGLSTYYINGVQRPERYLVSFDSKSSWYSYENGKWILVKSGSIPNKTDFDQYGMTIDEINALNEADFESLYGNGNQIYSFDVAVYFTSVDPYTTPSLKAITVTLIGGDANTNGEYFEKLLYTTKQQDFTATAWQKIKRIYPIEIQPKESEIYYFIVKDGSYKSYKNGAWQPVDPLLLSNVETNWVDSINGQGISQLGMTVEELRSIPETALNTLLPATNITVKYAMKVDDLSTKAYTSLITVDYVEDLFVSSNLVLKITMNDGTIRQFTGLTSDQVEDFMQWINERQYNRGPIFYCIKTPGTAPVTQVNGFVNYYMIQYVDVEEMP